MMYGGLYQHTRVVLYIYCICAMIVTDIILMVLVLVNFVPHHHGSLFRCAGHTILQKRNYIKSV